MRAIETSQQYDPAFRSIDSTVSAHNFYLSNAETELKKEKDVFAKAAFDNVGFLERNKALHDLSNEEPSVFWANLLISLLIIILETAPILAKMLLPVGPYDIALAKEELVPMSNIERALVIEQEKARTSNMSAV